MPNTLFKILLWMPRVLGLILVLLLFFLPFGMPANFSGGFSNINYIWPYLLPAISAMLILALGWRMPGRGAFFSLAGAVGIWIFIRSRAGEWDYWLSLPFFVLSAVFAASWAARSSLKRFLRQE